MATRRLSSGLTLSLCWWGLSCSGQHSDDQVVEVSVPSASATTSVAVTEPATHQPARTETFETCLAEIRKHPVRGPQPDAGESLYRQALAAEESDLNTARKLHFKLIDDQRGSAYVAASYFAFGEIFLRDAETDRSKLSFAEQAYLEALKDATSGTPLFWMSRLRLGEVYAQSNEDQKALDSLWKLFRDLDAAPPTERFCAEDRAGRAFGAVYAATGDPKKAAVFVRGVRQGRLQNRLLVDVARAYVDKAMIAEARDVLDGAANAPLERDDYLCTEGRRVVGAITHPPMLKAIERVCAP
ncbi:MAG: hypothetical protein U0271_41285 [Polyangiaceae bacterium]